MIAVFCYVLPAVAALCVLIAAFHAGHAVRRLFVSTLQGVAALFAVNAAGTLTGITIAVNPVTLTAAGVFGLPGVISVLLLNTIFR